MEMDMRTPLFLRCAAVLTFLLGVGHTLGRPWIPAHDPEATAVVEAMKSHRMHVMGFDRTFMEFYLGFGWMLSVDLFAQAVLLWLLAGLAARDPVRARPATVVFLIANVAQTALAAVFLFTAPLVLTAAVALCLVASAAMPARSAAQPA
jgi:hypothetical protein